MYFSQKGTMGKPKMNQSDYLQEGRELQDSRDMSVNELWCRYSFNFGP